MNKGQPLGGGGGGTVVEQVNNWQLRSYVYADKIRLQKISRLHYGTFFNLCRLEKISFDLPRRSGVFPWLCVCVRACVCVCGWVGGWVGGCLSCGWVGG
jgi:hypothetical protein